MNKLNATVIVNLNILISLIHQGYAVLGRRIRMIILTCLTGFRNSNKKSVTWLIALFISLLTSFVSPVNAATYFYHNDQLGAPQALSDSNQQVAWELNQKPFGDNTITTNSVVQNIRFPGQYDDIETGLSYNFFRTYDTSIGRYTQSDPIGFFGGINRYTYVSNNPVQYVDHNGLMKIRAYSFNAEGGGYESRYSFEFNPISENTKYTLIPRNIRRIESIIDLAKPKAAGPNNPYNPKEFLQCGLLDHDLQGEFANRFPRTNTENNRLTRSEALDFLNDMLKKHPEMSSLYDQPSQLLDKADSSGASHPINRLKERNF